MGCLFMETIVSYTVFLFEHIVRVSKPFPLKDKVLFIYGGLLADGAVSLSSLQLVLKHSARHI